VPITLESLFAFFFKSCSTQMIHFRTHGLNWCLYLHTYGHSNGICQLYGDWPIRAKNDWSRDLELKLNWSVIQFEHLAIKSPFYSDVNKDFSPRTRTWVPLCQGQGLHSQGPGQGPGFEDKDLSKCGHISVNIPGI